LQESKPLGKAPVGVGRIDQSQRVVA
jgi:hypothetical protein